MGTLPGDPPDTRKVAVATESFLNPQSSDVRMDGTVYLSTAPRSAPLVLLLHLPLISPVLQNPITCQIRESFRWHYCCWRLIRSQDIPVAAPPKTIPRIFIRIDVVS